MIFKRICWALKTKASWQCALDLRFKPVAEPVKCSQLLGLGKLLPT